jgi:hypothetical protein
LFLSDRSISSVSGAEWNSVHHSPEMSDPRLKRWASPPATPGTAAVAEVGGEVKSETSGGAGLLKFGPTAQPANNRRTVAPIRQGGCGGRLGLIRIGGSRSTATPGSVGDRGCGCTLMVKRLWAKAPMIASGAQRRRIPQAGAAPRHPFNLLRMRLANGH